MVVTYSPFGAHLPDDLGHIGHGGHLFAAHLRETRADLKVVLNGVRRQ